MHAYATKNQQPPDAIGKITYVAFPILLSKAL